MLKSILLCAFVAVVVSGVEFPKYFKPCTLSDTSINQCLVDQGNAALQGLSHGDEYYNIKPLVPFLNIPNHSVNVTTNFQINHTDIKVYNLDKMKIISADYVKTLNKFVFKLFNPEVFVTTKYELKLLQFMGEDIHGKGEFNMTVVNSEYIVEVYLTTITKEGVEYYALEKSSFDFIPEKLVLSFLGLFDGDIEKEQHANKHINKHWMDYWQNVRASYSANMNHVTESVFDSYVSKIPKNEFLLP